MTRSIFITGTDTGVGKTLVSELLITTARRTGSNACGMKPVASGCLDSGSGLRSEDALILQKASALTLAYELINPVALEAPCSPDIAADLAGYSYKLESVLPAHQEIAKLTDIVIVEGAGGWRTPSAPGKDMSDLARLLCQEVILVVGIRLGCINQAVLTAQAIRSDGSRLSGWVANCLDFDYEYSEATIKKLSERIPAPLLARLPRLTREEMGNQIIPLP